MWLHDYFHVWYWHLYWVILFRLSIFHQLNFGPLPIYFGCKPKTAFGLLFGWIPNFLQCTSPQILKSNELHWLIFLNFQISLSLCNKTFNIGLVSFSGRHKWNQYIITSNALPRTVFFFVISLSLTALNLSTQTFPVSTSSILSVICI